ncbi:MULTISPECIES: ABC transporter substrate-binding protein [unclassified Brevibacillus]|uniref:ABC transporter substrate-binding protein n=1 Tax=unclassified Brevibacillus TaxID=2684853 RepID=UPI00156B8243|nr:MULTISPECIES: ABC transporter substrate-binding protein [unclassified Brevibacillus]MDH6351973.1 peptide/nickel transport system substrate-binding protein [Brevibacillus sp. 1238]UED69702.1 ABC transporter substrate-binding protein [Brevibacillus sp. HD3.3A]
MFSTKMSKAMLGAVLGTVLLVTGCGGGSGAGTADSGKTATAPAAGKKVINIGLKADPPSMDPSISTSLYDRQVYASLYDKLFDIDAQGKIVPMLAESYEVTPDGKTYTLKLKQGVKFHDGTDFDADAVKFNFDRNISGEKSRRKGELKFVESVSVVDKSTVKIQLKEPFAPFLSVLTDRSGIIVSPKAVKEHGEQYLNHPVGTGPFTFVEQVKGDHVTLKKNENYWNGAVKVDEVNYKVFTNGTAKVQNLRSGTLDIIDDTPVKEIPVVKGDTNLQLIAESGMGFQGIYLNNSRPPFDNKFLRQAVDRAIEREAVVKVLYNGYAAPARTAFTKGNLAYNEQLNTPTAPNADEIKDLLEKGGKPGGFDFKLYIATSPENEQLGAVLQSMLKQYNINMTLEKLEYGQLIETGDKGEFDALQLGWSGRQDPDQNLHDFVVTGTSNNNGRISIPKLDELVVAARGEMDEAKRKALYDEAAKLLQDEAGYVYLYHQYVLIGMNKKVTGFNYVPDGLIRTATLDKQ